MIFAPVGSMYQDYSKKPVKTHDKELESLTKLFAFRYIKYNLFKLRSILNDIANQKH